jgi:hypothetical protein
MPTNTSEVKKLGLIRMVVGLACVMFLCDTFALSFAQTVAAGAAYMMLALEIGDLHK